MDMSVIVRSNIFVLLCANSVFSAFYYQILPQPKPFLFSLYPKSESLYPIVYQHVPQLTKPSSPLEKEDSVIFLGSNAEKKDETKFQCPQHTFGNFPHKYCHKYWSCHPVTDDYQLKAQEETCEAGMIFSVQLGTCDLDFLVDKSTVKCQMITRNLESSDYDDVEVLDLDDAGDEAKEEEELQEEQEKGYDPIDICDQPGLTPEQQEACQNKHWKQTDHF